MEPVPVTRGVRRTVRMAVALVIGQALLCALIGWLTLGRAHSGPDGSGAAVDQAAAPPPAVVPAPSPPAARPAPPAVTSRDAEAPAKKTRRPAKTTTSATSPDKTVSPAASTTEPPAPAPPPTTSPSSAPSPTPSSELILLPPMPPTESPAPRYSPEPDFDDEVQRNVTVGDRCRPEGAYGRTRDDRLVRCLRFHNDPPRWKIV
ncbi:hypothetical protein AB0J83_02660 [Actinoplanes sp. NPDC049596]|uniref:hypothetical protein n=1 Tax=unclassified Actinoplanes TaxID=2626549 RepID=UPI00341964A3